MISWLLFAVLVTAGALLLRREGNGSRPIPPPATQPTAEPAPTPPDIAPSAGLRSTPFQSGSSRPTSPSQLRVRVRDGASQELVSDSEVFVVFPDAIEREAGAGPTQLSMFRTLGEKQVTDGLGMATFERRSGGRGRVMAAKGALEGFAEFDSIESGIVVDVELRATVIVRVRVERADGKPAVGYEVTLCASGGASPFERLVRLDAQITAPPSGEACLDASRVVASARADRQANTRCRVAVTIAADVVPAVEIDLRDPPANTIVLRLPELGSITVRAHAASGLPLAPGVVAAIAPHPDGPFTGFPQTSFQSLVEGEARFGNVAFGCACEVWLTAWPPSGRCPAPRRATPTTTAPDCLVDLEWNDTPTLIARPVDERNAPCLGVGFEMFWSRGAETGLVARTPSADGIFRYYEPLDRLGFQRRDPEGWVRLRAVEPRSNRPIAESDRVHLSFGDSGTVDLGTIVMTGFRDAVSGVVLDGHGNGIPGVAIVCTPVDPSVPWRADDALTDRAGRFVVRALNPAARLTIVARSTDGESKSEALVCSAPAEDVVITMPSFGRESLRGGLVLDGIPPKGVTVEAVNCAEPGIRYTAIPDSAGLFEIVKMLAGKYHISLRCILDDEVSWIADVSVPVDDPGTEARLSAINAAQLGVHRMRVVIEDEDGAAIDRGVVSRGPGSEKASRLREWMWTDGIAQIPTRALALDLRFSALGFRTIETGGTRANDVVLMRRGIRVRLQLARTSPPASPGCRLSVVLRSTDGVSFSRMGQGGASEQFFGPEGVAELLVPRPGLFNVQWLVLRPGIVDAQLRMGEPSQIDVSDAAGVQVVTVTPPAIAFSK